LPIEVDAFVVVAKSLSIGLNPLAVVIAPALTAGGGTLDCEAGTFGKKADALRPLESVVAFDEAWLGMDTSIVDESRSGWIVACLGGENGALPGTGGASGDDAARRRSSWQSFRVI